ncbi:hypothetical protein [Aureimonas mangrovi]|uniref:hypothetical protein n=1 Tax=Aureimonas mangrovi TaxID=2758041 RepID=UPI00163D69A8|nr:hypothetical protein [Aureimonas mangrovi]
MSRREFTKVSPNLWRSRRFIGLTDAGKVLYAYLLTCEHQNSTGCFRLPDGYACADLQWLSEKYAGARDELVEADLIAIDLELSLIFVRRWFKHSPPMNPKHAQGTVKQISEIESDSIREIVEQEFADANGFHAAKPAPNDASRRSRLTDGLR